MCNRSPEVPEELRNALLEFTVSYLLEQPPDIVDFAIAFFTKLRNKKGRQAESSLSFEDEPAVGRAEFRRRSVFAESFDPEKDEGDTQKVVHPKSDEQRRMLAESVKDILIFRSLDNEQMNEVLDAMFEKKVAKDETVIKQGDDGDNFYVIQRGVYDAFIQEKGEEKLIQTYQDKGSFGELALLYNMPRAATIKARADGIVWAMDRRTFRRIVLKSAYKKRKTYEQLIDSVPMLKTLQPYERMNLADALAPKSFANGDCIIKQGDPADGMYFVENGTVQIKMKSTGSNDEKEIKRITKGGYFGELALVTNKPRAASAYAVGDTRVAFLDVDAFERLLGSCMQIMKRNINDYEEQLIKIFGSKQEITDVR